MSYPRFIENFKTNIEEREQNPRVRLAYLIQYCTGTAKEAISNCVMLPEDEGYSKAREVLHNSFGQNHIIIYACINKVTKRGVIRDREFDKLQQLARDMENCKINLTQLGCESEINAQSNLEKIVSRLPRYLQADWAKEVFAILEKGKVPSFENLTNFIMTKAKLASSAFGRLIGSKPQEDKLQKFKNKRQQGASLTVQRDLSNPCFVIIARKEVIYLKNATLSEMRNSKLERNLYERKSFVTFVLAKVISRSSIGEEIIVWSLNVVNGITVCCILFSLLQRKNQKRVLKKDLVQIYRMRRLRVTVPLLGPVDREYAYVSYLLKFVAEIELKE